MGLSKCILSVETAIFKGKTTENQLLQLKNCGFDKIELCAVKHRFNYNDIKYVNEMIGFILKNNIKTTSIHLPFGNDLDISSFDNNIRREAISAISKCIEIAIKLNCKILVLHPGVFMDEKQNRLKHLNIAVESISKLLCNLPDDMFIAVENLPPGFLAHTADELCTIVETVNDKCVGYCVDTGHAHIMRQTQALIERCGAKIYNVHIHDNHGQKDNHMMPLDGNIDWVNMFDLLNKVKFDGLLTYELTNEDNAVEKIRAIKNNFACLCNAIEVVPV